MKSQPEVIVIFKIFIKVMESGITLSMIISLLFAFLRTKDIRKKRIFSVAAISLGVVAAIVSAIVREIPNFVNRGIIQFLVNVADCNCGSGTVDFDSSEKKGFRPKGSKVRKLFYRIVRHLCNRFLLLLYAADFDTVE